MTSSLDTPKKESLVIIGTGWAGYKVLERVDSEKYDVTVVSPRNHFVFTPLLAGTAVGTLDFRCVTEPIRALKTTHEYYEASATGLDIKSKTLYCKSLLTKGEFAVPYDKLIIACGALTNTFNTPGVAENAFFLKEIAHARGIRSRILECLEYASTPNVSEEEKRAALHFAVVGGGPTGIELSAEMSDFMREDVARLYPKLKNYTKITVYDVAKKILGSFDDKLSEYATKKFQRVGTDIKTDTKIKEVQKDRLVLADETEIRTGLVVWATGNAPNPFIKSLPFPKDKTQRVLTDGSLHMLNQDNVPLPDVYALGDCASIQNYTLPQTAQVAEQQAKYLSKYLNNPEKTAEPFVYQHRGALAYVGDWEGLFDSPTSFKESGFWAWVIWRTAYLTQTVSWKNRFLIHSYWFLTWAFGRDTTRFY